MANDFKLVSFKTCPWVQRAAIALREKNIDYDIEYIDRNNRPDWFLAISPHSKVPVLRVGGDESLFESCAIAEYLDEAAEPQLHPQDLNLHETASGPHLKHLRFGLLDSFETL